MEIVVFILLAAVWAVFLVPSFFDSRRQAPINSTQDFAKSAARLNAVRVMSAEPAHAARRRVLARRRRTLIGLFVLAAGTLALAIYTGSVALLALTFAVDALLAAYIALLLHVKRQTRARPPQPVSIAPAESEEQAKVRVVAG